MQVDEELLLFFTSMSLGKMRRLSYHGNMHSEQVNICSYLPLYHSIYSFIYTFVTTFSFIVETCLWGVGVRGIHVTGLFTKPPRGEASVHIKF